ncbi:TlyA family rRNA (cytidine-2'-O)-methyltransferase [Polycladomyces abyssicola]|uniref:TlyA family rRNA (Cytidine-2'-O)-methyltransferase n=1 Tax=Polycladomyces abyssicola TaxID=1125966 RepID=A0A8D5ZNP8_9BACL|nr:TlyA family RNA methyltransferase [Polycladomyces abyssicola]BCU81601.1 TlyA family rRNA (cytidine-2'-O)-methyltransferase [Polycladomyces abyssicola]
MSKQRLDVLLVEKGYFESRQQAQRAIMAGLVRVNQERVDKPGAKIPADAVLEVTGQVHPFVSRGGLKLLEAIRAFQLDLTERVVIDIGASTGGFTDCALQHGAKRVYAVDVGYGQLAWKLRQDPRVVVMERTNFRYMKPEDLPGEQPDLATIDVSFISLSHILPPLYPILRTGGDVIALIKPQFEAGKEQVGKKGIVRDPAIHRQVIRAVLDMAASCGFQPMGVIPSPITGGEGNIEFLSRLTKSDTSSSSGIVTDEAITEAVAEAHRRHA